MVIHHHWPAIRQPRFRKQCGDMSMWSVQMCVLSFILGRCPSIMIRPVLVANDFCILIQMRFEKKDLTVSPHDFLFLDDLLEITTYGSWTHALTARCEHSYCMWFTFSLGISNWTNQCYGYCWCVNSWFVKDNPIVAGDCWCRWISLLTSADLPLLFLKVPPWQSSTWPRSSSGVTSVWPYGWWVVHGWWSMMVIQWLINGLV